jgi:ADP-ribose pyrophosphatase
MARIWQTVSTKTVFINNWFKIRHDRYILPNKKEGDYFFVATRGSVVIVPVDSQGKLVMVKQYRYLLKKVSVEFPMGGIEQGQTPLETAVSELAQETGFQARSIKKIGSFNPFIGITNEICHVYLATGLIPVVKKSDVSEKISVVVYSKDHVDELVRKRKIFCGQSIAAWQLAERYLNHK